MSGFSWESVDLIPQISLTPHGDGALLRGTSLRPQRSMHPWLMCPMLHSSPHAVDNTADPLRNERAHRSPYGAPCRPQNRYDASHRWRSALFAATPRWIQIKSRNHDMPIQHAIHTQRVLDSTL